MINKLWRLKLELILVPFALVGVYLALQSGMERASFTAHVTRIEKKIGTFKITDPKLIHIQAVETENPLEFAWRIYLPANYSMKVVQSCDTAGATTSQSTRVTPTEFIARVMLRESNGLLECYSSFNASGSLQGFQGSLYAAAVREQFGRLKIEQLGKSGPTTYQPNEDLTLLKISLPPELLQSMKLNFTDPNSNTLTGEIIQVEFLKPPPNSYSMSGPAS